MTTLRSESALPSLLDGRSKRLLIGGAWVENVSGKAFESINPSTGEVIAQLAEGDKSDIDLAVKAARAAFDGPWRRFTPAARQNVLLRLADLVEQHHAELRMLEILDMGSPIGPSITAGSSGPAEWLRYYAGWAAKIHGQTLPNSRAEAMFSYTLKEPVGVVGAIAPWNGPIANALWKIAPVQNWCRNSICRKAW